MRLLDRFTSPLPEAVENDFRSMGLEVPDWWKEKKACWIKGVFRDPIVQGNGRVLRRVS